MLFSATAFALLCFAGAVSAVANTTLCRDYQQLMERCLKVAPRKTLDIHDKHFMGIKETCCILEHEMASAPETKAMIPVFCSNVKSLLDTEVAVIAAHVSILSHGPNSSIHHTWSRTVSSLDTACGNEANYIALIDQGKLIIAQSNSIKADTTLIKSLGEQLNATNLKLDAANVQLNETNVKLDSTNTKLDNTNKELIRVRTEMANESWYNRIMALCLFAAIIVSGLVVSRCSGRGDYDALVAALLTNPYSKTYKQLDKTNEVLIEETTSKTSFALRSGNAYSAPPPPTRRVPVNTAAVGTTGKRYVAGA
jgi:hypothetical protein